MGGYYHSSLQAAAFAGRTEIVRMLSASGADPTLTGGGYGGALPAASMRGWNDIIAMLKDAGAQGDVTFPRLLGGVRG